MDSIEGYIVTNKETGKKSIVVYNELFYKVVTSQKGGLVEGTTYPSKVFRDLMKDYTLEQVDVDLDNLSVILEEI